MLVEPALVRALAKIIQTSRTRGGRDAPRIVSKYALDSTHRDAAGVITRISSDHPRSTRGLAGASRDSHGPAARVYSAHVGLAHDQRKRRSRRAGRPGSSFSAIAPEDFPYRHTCEGPDDMPAHVKAALLGSSVTIPIANGKLCLGTWQGIYLCEHRHHGGRRKLVLTLWGEGSD